MNISIAIATFILLILLIFNQIITWKWRVLSSPGFYFGLIWSLGVLGTLLFNSIDLLLEPYPEYINELNILIGFTALCFIFLTKKGRNKVNESGIDIQYFANYRIYHLLSLILLIIIIIEFFKNGASFNMGRSRDRSHEIQISLITNYIISLSCPLSIFAGYMIGFYLTNRNKLIYIIKKISLFFPLIGNLFFSITIGGRVNIIYSLIHYAIGASVCFPIRLKIKIEKNIIFVFILSFLLVNMFITAVSLQRDEYYQSESIEYIMLKTKNPLLAIIYGPIEYVVSSYNGYQFRRVDAVDKSSLGLGKYTFNGFINWTLPFSSQIGMGDFSIAKKLNIYYYNQETYDYQRPLYYTTHSCYLTLIKDFGFYGSFIFIMLLTYIAHSLFVKIQNKKPIRYSVQFYWYILFFQYWAQSNFYGSLSQSILLPLYGFLIVDILNYFVKSKR
ncbi:MAG: O-antigen ligase [Acidobacteriota bacterium]|nr:O-antigen ligase [Acidobacteriota bacterium]